MADEEKQPRQLGAIDPDGLIQLSAKEREMLLSKLGVWNTDGILRQRSKVKKWALIRNYVHGFDWANSSNTRSTAAQRILGTAADTGNVDNEPYTNNVMMRIHMSNMQRLGRFNPQIDTEPNDTTLENKEKARNSKIYLNDTMDRVHYKARIQRKSNRQICLAGASYLKVTYDPSEGCQKAEPTLDSFGRMIGYKDVDVEEEGDVVLDAVHPKNIILPSDCVDVREADWLIENNIRSTSYVLRKYGKTVKAVEISESDLHWWRLGVSVGGKDDIAQPGSESLCIVHEAWIERMDEFPKGAHIIWCGKVILTCTTLDDFYDGIPYFKAEYIYDDEDPDGETPYWFMIPMQDALNRVESDIRRHQIMMSKPKWQRHSETILQDPDGITNETAQVLVWTGTQAPGIIQAPDLPNTIFQWRDMVLGEMMSLGAAHDISRPKTPRSGTAIAYEQEQDDTTLAPTIDSIQVQIQDALQFALKLKSQYCPSPKRHSMKTGRGQIISQIFGGDDIDVGCKVRVAMQSGLPANKIARQQLIIQLVNQGVLTGADAKPYFEMGGEDDALHRSVVAIERAEKLIELLEKGGEYAQMQARPFDDYQTMLNEMKVVMQERWETYPAHVQQQFAMAYSGHQSMMQQAALPPPGPPGAPGAPVPKAPGAQPPSGPPGMPTSGQAGHQQPPKPAGEGANLYSIPGMEEPAGAPAGQPPPQ